MRARFEQLDDALELLHFAFRKVTEEPDRLLERRALGRVHHRILFFVRRNPGLSVGELLAVLAVTKQSLHKPMQTLVDQGLLEVSRSPTNRRIKILALTRTGLALEVRLSSSQRESFERAFAEVGAGAERAWARVMRELGDDSVALPRARTRPSA